MKLSLDDTYCIRSWDWDDVPSLAKHANNRNVWINLRDRFPYPYAHTDARACIRSAKEEKPETTFAIATPQEVIGGIGLVLQSDVHRMSAELGYWVAEPYWGKGIATLSRVLEKAGFTFEGRLRKNVIKDNRITDSLICAKLKEDL